MERHGPAPDVNAFAGPSEEIDAIRNRVMAFRTSGHQSLGIICKTQRESERVAQELRMLKVHLLSAESTSFREGVVVTSAHLAKGLEFDEVIVPFATAANFHSDIDKGMLYIACTRAMHRLTLTHSGPVTSFVA